MVINSNSHDNCINPSRLKIGHRLSQNTTYLFPVQINVINPLNLRFLRKDIPNRTAYRNRSRCCNQDNILRNFRLWTEQNTHVNPASIGRIKPSSASATSICLLLSKYHKPLAFTIQCTPLCFHIRGINALKHLDFLTVVRLMQTQPDSFLRQHIAFFFQAVTTVIYCLNLITFFFQSIHCLPDSRSRHAK